MTLKFEKTPPGYNDETETIVYMAFDGDDPIGCGVMREALRRLVVAGADFDKMDSLIVADRPEPRAALEKIAARKYEVGATEPNGMILIRPADIEPFSGTVGRYERSGVIGRWAGRDGRWL